MSGTTIGDQVIALCEQMSGKEANAKSRLVEDLELDSLDRIQLAMKLEEHFGIEISDEEVDDQKLGVVSGLIAHVERKVDDLPRRQWAHVAAREGSEL